MKDSSVSSAFTSIKNKRLAEVCGEDTKKSVCGNREKEVRKINFPAHVLCRIVSATIKTIST